MNITLISTDMDVWAFGLRSISAVLKAAGHWTQLVFMKTNERQFSKSNLDEIASLARHADIIGVGCLARGSTKAMQLIQSLHEQKKLVIWGGIHASLNPEECTDWADIVCRGEGEEVMLELVERLEQGKDWKDIANLAFKEKEGVKLNEIRPPIANLDDLPLPDFTFENEYHLTKKGFVQVNTLPEVSSSKQIMFISSRGCAFRCTYCCNRKLKELYTRKGHYIRRMSVSRLIEHTQNLRKIFPSGEYFYFIDEDFGARPIGELTQLSEEFPQKVGLPFACLTHPAQVNKQKMDSLVKAGLFRLYMGIESGSERTRREIYDRHVSNDIVIRAAKTISCYPQVLPTYFFIIGNPYEEMEDLFTTVRLISELPYGSYIIMYNLVFFPGSAIYERAVRDRLIEGPHDSGYELNFLGGFNYKQHVWKQKNLDLNGLIFLMEGHCTINRIGILPRSYINSILTSNRREPSKYHLHAIKVMISLKFLLNSVRHSVARLLKKIIGDPTAVYNLGYYLKRKISPNY